VKVFGPELAELSQPQRALALHSIREAVERDLAAHPEARLRLEVFERPPDLQALLDDLAQRHTRFGYTVLPGTNGH